MRHLLTCVGFSTVFNFSRNNSLMQIKLVSHSKQVVTLFLADRIKVCSFSAHNQTIQISTTNLDCFSYLYRHILFYYVFTNISNVEYSATKEPS